jgi:DNA polymerase I
LTPGNSLILRGLEAIRGDWSELAKKTQKEIINIILSGHDVEKAAEHLRKKIRDVESRKIPVNELAINVKLTRGLDSYATNTPHVVAARMAKEKGYPVQRGFVVSYIRVNGDQKVKLADECKPDEYDTNYYIEHQIIRAVYKIFELFGYGLEKLKAGQTTLEGYDN